MENKHRLLSCENKKAVLAQIQEKEQQKIAERIAVFQEGIDLDLATIKRNQMLEDAKNKKIDELRFVVRPNPDTFVRDSTLYIIIKFMI